MISESEDGMKKSVYKLCMSAGCAAAMLVNTIAAAAQGAAGSGQRTETPRVSVITPDSGSGNQAVFISQDGVQTELPVGSGFTVVQDGAAGGTIAFAASEMSFDTKVVKGAPYSAEAVTEVVQALPDGNRIVRRSSTQLYRDSEGRTRREQSVNAVGPWVSAQQGAVRVYINDPVSNLNYILDPQSQTARKLNLFMRSAVPVSISAAPPARGTGGAENVLGVSGGSLQLGATNRTPPQYPAVAKAAGAEGPVQVQVTVNENGEVVSAEAISGHPLLREAAVEAARQWRFKPTTIEGKSVKTRGTLTFNFTLAKNAEIETRQLAEAAQPSRVARTLSFEAGSPGVVAAAAPLVVESENILVRTESRREELGKQFFEGIETEGTRMVTTIPAGAIGNERPIEIVHERWYSPELQTVVMSRHYDPRSGETVYRLSNIVRAEPALHLFQVPGDYTITDESNVMELRRKIEEQHRRNNQR
jgi:TonB family protein